MGFTNEVWLHIEPRWKQHYIAYQALKQELRKFQTELRKDPKGTKFEAYDSAFFNHLGVEMARTDAFFASEVSKCEHDLDRIAGNGERHRRFRGLFKYTKTYRRQLLAQYTKLRLLRRFADENASAVSHLVRKRVRYNSGGEAAQSLRGQATALVQQLLGTYKMAGAGDVLDPPTARLHELLGAGLPRRERSARVKAELRRVKYDSPFATRAFSVKWVPVCVGLVLAAFTLWLPLLPQAPAAHRCLAMIVFVASLWCTEALPFFATALAVPVLAVVLRVIQNPAGTAPLAAHAAAVFILGRMFDHVIALVLGGFCISLALHEYGFDRLLASVVLSRVGDRPHLFLLAVMTLGAFLSMWMSNVAAPVLVLSIALPILNELPSAHRAYVRLSLLGIAFACNIGGMMTPIASPQNAVTIEAVEEATEGEDTITFLQWVLAAAPVCVLFLLAAWYLLLWSYGYRPRMGVRRLAARAGGRGRYNSVPAAADETSLRVFESDVSVSESARAADGGARALLSLPKIARVSLDMDAKHWTVLLTSLGTIALLCTVHLTRDVSGDMGIVALLPVVVFFGSGVLGKQHLRLIAWDIILLMAGGACLGAAVESSTLINVLAHAVAEAVRGYSPFVVMLAFNGLIVAVTTFVSHTVSAIMIMPLIARIGLDIGGMQLLVLSTGLMLSSAMALPMSSFPNVAGTSAQDDTGSTYLRAKDYIKNGLLMSAVIYSIFAAVGFGWFRLLAGMGVLSNA